MGSDREPMDEAAVRRGLADAIKMQHRSVLAFTLAAGTVPGVEGLAFGDTCRRWAGFELDDLARLAEKLVVLGGEPPTEVAPFKWSGKAEDMASAIVDQELECLTQLHGIIADSGQEPRSEALEHLVEHLIIRKQEQVDRLLRILGRTEPKMDPADD